MKIIRTTSYPDNPEHITLIDNMNTNELSIANWIPSSLEAGVLKKATFELDSGGLKTIVTYEPEESDAKAGGSG